MSLIDHLTAPAPRLILRLVKFASLLKGFDKSTETITTICEIGPGLGDAASLAASKLSPASIDLYESSDDARDILSRRFSNNTNIDVHKDFASAKKQYDVALCFEVLEHIENDLVFMEQINKTIKNGGVFCGSVPCYMSKWQAVDELAGHYRRYEADELRHKLEKAGFTDIEIHTYGFPLINILYPWRQYYYSKLLSKRKDHDKDLATAKSGISRGLALSFNKKFVYTVVTAFSWFQSIPGLTKLGDGFVFACKKS